LEIVTVEISVPRTVVPGAPYSFEIREGETARLKILHGYKTDEDGNAMVDPDGNPFEIGRSDAVKGACEDGASTVAGFDIVDAPWADVGAPLYENQISTMQAVADPGIDNPVTKSITFKQGGKYKVCFTTSSSDLDSWDEGKVDVPEILITVTGIYSNCEGPDCLEKKRYDCYALEGVRSANNSCVADYSGDGSGYDGDIGKLSWSEDYNASYDDFGNVTGIQEEFCQTSSGPSTVICDKGKDCDGTGGRILPLSDPQETNKITKSLPQVVDTLTNDRYRTYSVKLCYCPNFANSLAGGSACDSPAEFLQSVGTVHIWTTKVCLTNDPTCAVTSYHGVVPQTRFMVKVNCPLDVCPPTLESRLKIVDVDRSAPELPSWHTDHNCKQIHESRAVIYDCPHDAHGNPTTHGHPGCALKGGRRQDYKLFGSPHRHGDPHVHVHENEDRRLTGHADDDVMEGTMGFMPFLGETPHERLNFGQSKELDLCFCEANCDSPDSFFKVGAMRVVPFRPVKAIGNADFATSFVEYTNRPGIIGFVRNKNDDLISGAQGGLMKILRVPDAFGPTPEVSKFEVYTDHDCARMPYDTDLVPELNVETAWTTYYGTEQPVENLPDRSWTVLGFNNIFNETHPRKVPSNLTITQPGLIAICYCSEVLGPTYDPDALLAAEDEGLKYGTCKGDEFWTLALLFTLKGATPNHYWEYSTNVVFRLDIFGWGMNSDHTVRILQSGADCMVPDGNPLLVEPTMSKGCPAACSAFSRTAGNEPNIALKTTGWDAVNCDEQNQKCEISFIRKVVVLDAHTTQLEFTAPPKLENGDRIMLTENFGCDTCTPDQMRTLRGGFDFADDQDLGHHHNFADEYVTGHLVTKTSENTRFLINVGWSSLPRIEVVEDGADFGKWKLISRARTALELKGTRAMIGLKVCWSPGGSGLYSAQIGTLVLRDPSVMGQPIIAFSSRMLGNRAPIIISFKTATAKVGERYTIETTEPMLLRLQFLNINILNVYLSDLEASDLEERNLGEDELHEASQYICGKLFKELWSTDKKNGFPLPKGCYFTTVGRQRDLVLVFEPMSGLSPGESYQLVVNGAGMTGIEKDGEYLQIFTMDEVYSKPYSAIEMGRAQMLRAPLLPAGAADPQMERPNGLKIINDDDGVVNVEERDLVFLLKGHPTEMAAIVPRTVFRLFMWPLTMWATSSCNVKCIGYQDQSCGAMPQCKTEPVGVYGNQNLLIWEMPAEMPPIFDDVVHKFTVQGMNYPTGGFFPNRLAAEVSRPGTDTKPHYMLSTGAMVMKMPDEGYSVAKLLQSAGDGNNEPFRGGEKNVLYLRVILGATLYGGGSAYPIASFTINLPTGYEVISMGEAEMDLRFFENRPPGRGTLGNPENWVIAADGSSCSYMIKSHEILYAGSSIMIRAEVYNPDTSVIQDNVENAWSMSTNSKGLYFASAYGYTTETVQFFATSAEYSAATSVLGLFSDYSVQSLNPALSTPITVQTSLISVFFNIDTTTVSGARILVHAPMEGYNFGRMCRTVDLDDAYFSTDHGEVHPIPAVTRCIGHVSEMNRPNLVDVQPRDDESTMTNQAVIDTSLRLLAHRSYAFGVYVENPETPVPPEKNKWYVWALTPSGSYVAGTPTAVPANPYWWVRETHATNPEEDEDPPDLDSIKLFRQVLFSEENPSREGIINFGVSIMDRRPYRLSGAQSYVTIFPIILPEFDEALGNVHVAKLRLTAPMGFMFSDQDFKWCSTAVRANLTCHALYNKTKEDLVGTYAKDWIANQPDVSYPWEHFPGGYPSHVDGNVLYFNESTYFSNIIYGFQAAIDIPDYNPLMSWNKFTIEFAYDEPQGGLFFGSMTADRIGSIRSFSISPESQIAGAYQNVTVKFDLATAIPEGGGLFLVSPDGYTLSLTSEPEFFPMEPDTVDTNMAVPLYKAQADLSAPVQPVTDVVQSPLVEATLFARAADVSALGSTIPSTTKCTYNRKEKNNAPTMRCTVGSGGLPAGAYAFKMTMQNTNIAQANFAEPSSPCGYRFCWYLKTVAVYGDNKDLDLNSTIPSYDVLTRMFAASLVQVEGDMRLSSGRNDRPGRENNVVVSFTLAQDVGNDGLLRLEAPYGYIFDENCFFGLEYRSNYVFGEGVPMPDQFVAWDEESAIIDCKAKLNVAELSITRGLKKESSYAFRIRILQNAYRQPALNKWKVVFNKEESLPFPGFPLWMMTKTRVRPATTAKNLNEEEALGLGLDVLDTANPVTIFFTPSRTVSRKLPPDSGALLRVVAPKAFRIVEPCHVRIVQEPFVKKQLGQQDRTFELMVWKGSDLTCFMMDTNMIDVRINVPEHELISGNPYQVIVPVYNPAVVQDLEGIWNVQTYSEDRVYQNVALDEVTVEGFRINRALGLWQYRNLDEDGLPQVYGRMPVKGMLFMMKFPDRLDILDTVLIQGPAGFNLAVDAPDDVGPDWWGFYPCKGKKTNGQIKYQCKKDGLLPCNNFRWETLGNAVEYDSTPRCKGNMLKLLIMEKAPVAPMSQFKLLLDTTNPPVTPLMADNLWTCGHFRVDPASLVLQTMSTHTAPSWEVVSQLENVLITMEGPDYGARGTGSIELTFTPMSVANRVKFLAREPPEFDFRPSGLVLPGQEVVQVEKEFILMRMLLNARESTRIRIVNVKLGYPGGQTVFDITTYTETIKVDEKLRYRQGFVLPGAVHIHEARFDSNYTIDPALHPIKSQWNVQLSSGLFEIKDNIELENARVPRTRAAFANLKLQFSRDTYFNESFVLKAFPFYIVGRQFRLELLHDDGTREDIDVDYKIEESTSIDPENDRLTLAVKDTLRGKILRPGGIPKFTTVELNIDLMTPDADKYEEKLRDGVTPKWPVGWLIKTEADWPKPVEDADGRIPRVYPSNTNDGHYADFNLVREVGFDVHAGMCLACRTHAPPGASINVAVQVNPFDTAPTKIYIHAPRGFEFMEDCLYAAQGTDIESCETIEPYEGHATALLSVPKGLRANAPEFILLVRTPFQTPDSPAWYVNAIRDDYQTFNQPVQVGWAENERGFDVLQMDLSRVILPNIPGVRVPAAFGFRSRDRLTGQATLELTFPPNYIPMCETINFLSLPGNPGCITIQDSPPYEETLMYRIRIQVNQTLVQGDYSFMMMLLVPPMTPENHEFSMVLMDQQQLVKDAAMNLNVPDMIFGASITAHPHCYFKQLEGCLRYCETKKVLTIAWNVNEPIGQKIYVRHIMVRFPDSVTHDIIMKDDGERHTNEHLVETLGWTYTKIYPEFLDMLGFDVDESNWQPGVGEYDVTMPVTIPDFQPGFNVWTIHLCSSGGADRCMSLHAPPKHCPMYNHDEHDCEPGEDVAPHDRSILVSFPIAGFKITDESPPRGEVKAFAARLGFIFTFFSIFS
jgi:hypothetical protein